MFQCAESQTVQDKVDNVVNGTGTIVYTTVFTVGVFHLDRSGPRGTGAEDFSGTLNTTTQVSTVEFENYVVKQSLITVSNSGQFDDSGCFPTYVIAMGVGQGNTDSEPAPPDYPAFPDADCAPTPVLGNWGDLIEIQIQVDCPIPVESSTCGRIRAIHRGPVRRGASGPGALSDIELHHTYDRIDTVCCPEIDLRVYRMDFGRNLKDFSE